MRRFVGPSRHLDQTSRSFGRADKDERRRSDPVPSEKKREAVTWSILLVGSPRPRTPWGHDLSEGVHRIGVRVYIGGAVNRL